MKHLFLKLLICLFTFSAHGSQGIPRGWNLISLKDLKLKTIDGDTFEADINRNGRIAGKQERVRLLYVDTPELNQSHKGKDLLHGIPAKDFLKQKLNTGRCSLWVDPVKFQGESRTSPGAGRMLGNQHQTGIESEGHSYFDTRFSRPRNYVLYARQEAQAFNSRRGIWSSLDSIKAYLKRLRDEGKTVYSLEKSSFPG